MQKKFTSYLSNTRYFLFYVMSFFIHVMANAQGLIVSYEPVITTGLNTPVDVVNAGDGSNRLFIASQKDSTIRVFDQNYNFLDTLLVVPGVRISGFEEGLLSIAFHPDYENNRFFFVYYTNHAGDLELARYQTSSINANKADPGSKITVGIISHPTYNIHNGAKLNFGPDGYLYIATGDGGSPNDNANNAQNGNSLLGKMLRIDVSTGSTPPFYSIPPDNPYITDPAVLDEIWAVGFRNPFRWSFDKVTGDMWIGDVGQSSLEEISYRAGPSGSTGGVNYGWPCFEGTLSYNGCTVLTGPGISVPPVYEYTNPAAGPAAITGGMVYRGIEYADLIGIYLAADFYSGNVYLIERVGLNWSTTVQAGLPDWIVAFGEAENGTLYALSLRGTLYKIVATAQGPTPVTLVGFTAISKSGVNELNWETLNEVNVQQYEIESSSDGTNFNQVGIVTANNSRTYRFNHTVTTNKKIYYRLRILDNDRTFEYSKIIPVTRSATDQGNFVRPSVIRNNILNLVISEPFNQVQLIHSDGREVWKQNVTGRAGNIRFPLPALLPGSYFIRLVNNEKIITQKILIQ